MSAVLRRLPAVAGLAGLAGTRAQVAGHRAFARLVRRDVQALHARAAPARAGVVTEQMPAGLPDPVRRYLRYAGVAGKPFPRTIRLHQKGRMRPRAGPAVDAPRRRGPVLGAAARLVWVSALHWARLRWGRAHDMYAGGTGRMLVKVASLWPVADASGEKVDRNGLMRYRTPGASSPDTWSTPITGYGEFERLRLPVRGPAIWELPGEDDECIEVTITGLQYGTGAACLAGSPRVVNAGAAAGSTWGSLRTCPGHRGRRSPRSGPDGPGSGRARARA